MYTCLAHSHTRTISCAVAMARESRDLLTVERLQEVLSILADEEGVDT
jgi:hypothetical protein